MKAEKWYDLRYDKPDLEWAETFKLQSESRHETIRNWEGQDVHQIKEDMPEHLYDIRTLIHKAGSNKHNPQLVASWLTGELLKILNYHNKTYSQFLEEMSWKEKLVWKKWMEHFFNLIEQDRLTDQNGEKVLREMVAELEDPYTIAFENDLFKEDLNLDSIIEQVVEEHPEAVNDYQSGEKDAINHLVGQVMQKTNGKADPQKTTETLKDKL